jgi:hypothetical protein
MKLIRLDTTDADRDPLLARELSLMEDALDLIYGAPLDVFCEPLPLFRPDPWEPGQ